MNLQGKNVLVTSGGTREYIDDVRVVTNISSGALGAKIAEEFYNEGSRVHYIHGKNSVMPKIEEGFHKTSGLINYQFVTCNDLKKTMETVVTAFNTDIVICCAAVSDFTFDRTKPIKCSSSDIDRFIEHLRQTIKPTEKIINYVKSWKPNCILCGFKFTVGKTIDEQIEIARNALKSYNGDFVVVNDKKEMTEHKNHVARIVSPKKISKDFYGKNKIANGIVEFLRLAY